MEVLEKNMSLDNLPYTLDFKRKGVKEEYKVKMHNIELFVMYKGVKFIKFMAKLMWGKILNSIIKVSLNIFLITLLYFINIQRSKNKF